ncbi:hypothetical protein RHMOL_Rhmol08G0052600 [Rhododendron molle]|uniref:Uncharacterized protein n=1 Tax=Rhododendron molle TaxID=49168 RepID=A0ACC0ML83_RHOML|nr:hypothetical protein RHMOL_Rhmol08G0052600 [Rhododendron molle]
MNSKETDTNKSNLPSGRLSSPKRRKMEKVKQTVQNGQQIPITTGNQTNTSNPPSQFLPGLGATPVSPVNYVLRDQLLRRSLRQQQRLTNGAPMVPKCSMQQTSKALDTKDNNAPIPADPVSSQAVQGDEFFMRMEVLLGIPTPCSKLLSKHPSQVVEDAYRKAPTSAISPSTAAPIKDIVSGILDGREILITFGNFPYYLCDRTKHALVASFFLHTKHKEYARRNAAAGRFRIIFSGPTGSRIYQEKLAMALAHHVGAKLLVLGNSFFPADMSTMGRGPSRDVLWTHFRHRATQSLANPSHSEMSNHSFKKGDRVVFVGSNSGGLRSTDSPRGPTFGSLGEIVSTSHVSYLSKFGVRFDNPIHGGLDLGGQCKAGYGFNCNANELCLDPTTLKDFNKSIANNYLEAIMCASRDSPLILFVKDVDKFVQESPEAYLVVKYLINKLPENVFVIGSQTDTENNKEKESYFGKYEKDRKLTEMAKLLSNLFPNQIPIEMPEDEKHIAVLKHKFSEDSELILAKENITCLQNLMEYPQSNENPNLVLSLESVEYGVNVLRETQPELKTSEKLLKDVVTENGFEKILLGEVIPPNEAGVKFDDIGALENVKDTLKELVMLPLQRPELFCKGQLRKPCKGILLFGPPGTGKTMLAKAIATEAGANFINISASTIASKWYGDAEKYVRAVFSLAIKISPSIIFVDEVDSLLGHRGNHEHELTRRIKNEFIFMVNLPDAPNRTKILQVILEKEELSPDVDFDVISRMTDGYSGSDLKNLCVTAAYCPIREILQSEKQKIAATVPDMEPLPASNKTSEIRPTSMEDFKYAREQISASFSTESMNMNELLKWNELYGEGGSRRKTTLSYFL